MNYDNFIKSIIKIKEAYIIGEEKPGRWEC